VPSLVVVVVLLLLGLVVLLLILELVVVLLSYKSSALWQRAWYMWRGSLPAEVRYYQAEATDVNFEKKLVNCVGKGGGSEEGSTQEFGLHYDKLVVAIGSTTNTFGTGGVDENCIFMKEISDGVAARTKIFEQFEKSTLPASDGDTSKEQRTKVMTMLLLLLFLLLVPLLELLHLCCCSRCSF